MRNNILYILLMSLLMTGCSKKEFLDEKPVKGNLIPKTLDELQGLLNNYAVINKTPDMIMLSSDEYEFLTPGIWQARVEWVRNSYIWTHNYYETSNDWNSAYQAVLYANVVIAGAENVAVTAANKDKHGDVQGQGYFLRAFNFFHLANTFALPYAAASAATTLGIPMPLSVDPNSPKKRSSLEETYQQIIADLTIAINSFSNNFPDKTTLSSKAAAYALLARVYLVMGDFEKAKDNAAASLELRNGLLDFNTLDATSNTPFDGPNPELLFNTTHGEASVNYDWYAINYGSWGYNFSSKINPELLALYNEHDLRLKLFFFQRNEDLHIKALYQKSNLHYAPFSGLATDEVYLILAECLARENDTEAAIEILNKLALSRFPADHLPEYVAASSAQALELVLAERRRELVYRGSRWLDIRRLNAEGKGILLKRVIEGVEYALPSGDKRFALPIPLNEIGYSGIEQN